MRFIILLTFLSVTASADEVIRFEWNRSFHSKVLITIETLDGKHIVNAKMENTDQLEFSISDLKFESLMEEASSCGFFNLKQESKGLTIDGAFWKLMVTQNSEAHEVERRSPETGCVRQLGETLIELSRLEVEKSEIY